MFVAIKSCLTAQQVPKVADEDILAGMPGGRVGLPPCLERFRTGPALLHPDDLVLGKRGCRDERFRHVALRELAGFFQRADGNALFSTLFNDGLKFLDHGTHLIERTPEDFKERHSKLGGNDFPAFGIGEGIDDFLVSAVAWAESLTSRADTTDYFLLIGEHPTGQ